MYNQKISSPSFTDAALIQSTTASLTSTLISLSARLSLSSLHLCTKYYSATNTDITECEEREKTSKMQQSDVYYQLLSQHVSGIIMPIFRRTKTVCYCIWCTALVLLDVAGSGCGALRCRMRARQCSHPTTQRENPRITDLPPPPSPKETTP